MRIIYCDLLQLIEKLSFCFCCCCFFEHTKTFDLPYTVGGICALFCVSSHYKKKKGNTLSRVGESNKESRGGVSQVKNSVHFDWSRLSYWSTNNLDLWSSLWAFLLMLKHWILWQYGTEGYNDCFSVFESLWTEHQPPQKTLLCQ